MNSKTTRRSLISVIGSISVAGCLNNSTTGKLAWQNEDEFPDDENRNRKCEIRDLDSITQEIKSGGTDLGYSPIAYTIHGREDLHGTNQHVDITIKAEKEVDLHVTNTENVLAAQADEKPNTTENISTNTSNELGFNPIEGHTALGITNHTDQIQIPDGETYTLLFSPHEKPMTEPITVTLEMDCSYYLPYEEYKDLQE